jgi:uncharacterized membrane protein YhaH (DUF805 family)
MSHPRPLDRLPRLSLEGRGGWLAVGLLGAYLIWNARDRNVPLGSGVEYLPAWIIVAAVALLAGSLVARRLRPSRPWLRPVEAAAILAVVAMVLTDLTMTYQPLRDLGIYL